MAELDNVGHGFSWRDSIQAALGPCLGCLNSYCGSGSHSSSGDEHENENSSRWRWRQRQRHSYSLSVDQNDGNRNAADRRRAEYYGELEGLLADVSDTDNDAERMSLHSTIGAGRKSKSKTKSKKGKNNRKSVTLFGWDMFGRRRSQPIALPLSDDEDDDRMDTARRHANLSNHYTSGSSASLSPFDSDAAPLDPDSISTVVSRTRNQDHQVELEGDDDSTRGKRSSRNQNGKRKSRKSGHVAPQLQLNFEPSFSEQDYIVGNASQSLGHRDTEGSQFVSTFTPPISSSSDQLSLPRLDVNLPTSPFAPFSVPLPQAGPTPDTLGLGLGFAYTSPLSQGPPGFSFYSPSEHQDLEVHDVEEEEEPDADFGGEMYSRKAPNGSSSSATHSGGSVSNSNPRSVSVSQVDPASYYRRQAEHNVRADRFTSTSSSRLSSVTVLLSSPNAR